MTATNHGNTVPEPTPCKGCVWMCPHCVHILAHQVRKASMAHYDSMKAPGSKPYATMTDAELLNEMNGHVADDWPMSSDNLAVIRDRFQALFQALAFTETGLAEADVLLSQQRHARRTADRGAVTMRTVQRTNDERKARWHEGGIREWSVLEWAGAMCGESGEAANVAKKLLRIDLELTGNEAAEHVITDRTALLEKLAGEIGGTVLYAALLASNVGLDFNDVVVATFNAKSEAMGFPDRLGITSTAG